MKPGDPRRIVFPFLRRMVPLAAAVAVSACVNSPPLKNDYEFQSLLSEYQWRSAQIQNEQQQKVLASIKRIDVRKSGSDYLVSVDLADAPVAVVIDRILAQTSIGYDLANIRITGRATVRFHQLPLVEALNLLVNPSSISVAKQDDILTFRRGVRANASVIAGSDAAGSDDEDSGDEGSDDEGSDDDASDKVYEVVPLSHIKVADAASLLRGLYNFENLDEPAITIGELPERSAVYIGGSPTDVANSVAVLHEADQDVPHVLIEALVVDLDVAAVENLGTQIKDAAIGDFSDINLIPGAAGQNVVFTFLQGAANLAQLTAVIDLLASVDKAQVLSRPYLATRSNQAAQIQVVTERFVAVQQNSDGTDFTSTDAIQAGVTLDVLPTVLAGDTIQLDMTVEESEFDQAVGGVLVQKARNSARSSMTVASGQTIVVGGLNRRRDTAGNAGIPKVRRIPILGSLFNQESSFERTTEVVVYLTPYIWSPSMGTPLPRPGIPQLRESDLTDIEIQLEAHHSHE